MRRFLSSIMLKVAILAAAFAALSPVSASDAGKAPWALTKYIDRDLLTWVNAAPIVDAIEAQNQRHIGPTLPHIVSRHDVISVRRPPVSDYLRAQMARSGGRITSVTLRDAQGLTVAENTGTAAHRPGEKPQFTSATSEAFLVDAVRFDDNTQTYQGRVTVAVVNPATGMTIGAITVRLEAVAFF